MPNSANDQWSAKKLTWEIEEFLLDRSARNFTKSTLDWYRRCLEKWAEFCAAHQIESTVDVTASHIRRYLVDLGEQHSRGGVVTLFTGLRAFLNWYKAEYAPAQWNPLDRIKAPKRPKERIEPISLEAFQQLVAQTETRTFSGDRDRALLHLLLDTGIRHQEATDLVVGDIDLQSGQVLIRQGKGQKSRVVYLGAKTRRLLLIYFRHRKEMTPDSPLWISQQGNSLSKDGLRQVVRRLAQRAGIPEPGMHAFRRAFAVNSLRNGMDLISLQRLMGHANLETIHRYLAQVDDDLRQAHYDYGIVDRLKLK